MTLMEMYKKSGDLIASGLVLRIFPNKTRSLHSVLWSIKQIFLVFFVYKRLIDQVNTVLDPKIMKSFKTTVRMPRLGN